jgi:hypothetical protein
LQFNVTNLTSHTAWKHAFSVDERCLQTAQKLRTQKDDFYGKPGARTHRRAWELAVLYHNWPTAAINMAAGGGPYKEKARNTRAEQWIIDASGGALRTPNEWVEEYIRSKTLYVRNWTK